MTLDNKSVMAIHWGTKKQYRIYNLFCSNTLGCFLITSSLPNLGPCYRLDKLQLLLTLTRMNETVKLYCSRVSSGPSVYFFWFSPCVHIIKNIYTIQVWT
jgi:hypothetical protein